MAEQNTMEVASGRLSLYSGHDVEKRGLTPAEFYLLCKLFTESSKLAEPVTISKVQGYAQQIDGYEKNQEGDEIPSKPKFRPRTAVEEVARLKAAYGIPIDKKGKRLVDNLFPDDANPKIPMTFDEAKTWLKPVPVATTPLGGVVGAPTEVAGLFLNSKKEEAKK